MIFGLAQMTYSILGVNDPWDTAKEKTDRFIITGLAWGQSCRLLRTS